ncbi:hypothetical protein PIB30_072342 [Stylosanthes scabra]|uniref:Uncharacterized protein n=1 Tax=Stylosanthes scabra TaxID=79078 RepID=A0ABU6ZMP0_9FABA|nr:hypothetical protein [Stylosanthes scabra]
MEIYQSRLPFAANSSTDSISHDKGKGKSRRGKSQGGKSHGGKNKLQCSYCGKLGHSVDTCYKKHGYPPHFKGKNGADSTGSFSAAFKTEGDSEKLSDCGHSSHVEDLGVTRWSSLLSKNKPYLHFLVALRGSTSLT